MDSLKNSTAVLADIAKKIDVEQEAIQSAFAMSLTHAIEAGELLLKAKKVVSHGEWLSWLKLNCIVSARLAQTYMRLAREREQIEAKCADSALLSNDSALKLLASPKGVVPGLYGDAPAIEAPSPGHYLTGTNRADIGEDVAYIMPSNLHGFYHVASMFVEDREAPTLATSTIRPVHSDALGAVLMVSGFPVQDADWEEAESPGPFASNPWNEELSE